MQYNTKRAALKISEYGRNLQTMVEYVKTIEDNAKRNKMAQGLVQLMAQMNPRVREQENYEQKLWNHLFVIADYELDVDCPFEKPTREKQLQRPEKMAYPKKNPKYKQYGNSTLSFIEKAKTFKAGEEKQAFTASIANLMKKSYLNWNRDSVNDQTIYDHLEELSSGALKLEEGFELNHTSTFNLNKKNYRKKRNFSKNGKSNQKYRKR